MVFSQRHQLLIVQSFLQQMQCRIMTFCATLSVPAPEKRRLLPFQAGWDIICISIETAAG